MRARVSEPLKTLRVQTVDGRFHPMRDCLLPGPIVPGDGSRDASIAVNETFHSDDLPVFREFGLHQRPIEGHQPADEPWFEEYRNELYEGYVRSLAPRDSRPQIARMNSSGAAVAKSLHLLRQLSDEGKAAFVKALPDGYVVDVWTMQFGAPTRPSNGGLAPALDGAEIRSGPHVSGREAARRGRRPTAPRTPMSCPSPTSAPRRHGSSTYP